MEVEYITESLAPLRNAYYYETDKVAAYERWLYMIYTRINHCEVPGPAYDIRLLGEMVTLMNYFDHPQFREFNLYDLTLYGFFYYKKTMKLIHRVIKKRLKLLRVEKEQREFESRISVDTENNLLIPSYLTTYQGVKDVMQVAVNNKDTIYTAYDKLLVSLDEDCEKWVKEKPDAIALCEMLNAQYFRMVKTKWMTDSQKFMMKMKMMNEEEKRNFLNEMMKTELDRLEHSKLNPFHMFCCDPSGNNWDGRKFVKLLVSGTALDDLTFRDMYDYLDIMIKLKFVNCQLDNVPLEFGKNWIRNGNFDEDEKGKNVDPLDELLQEEGECETEEKVGKLDEKSGEMGEKEKAEDVSNGEKNTVENGENEVGKSMRTEDELVETFEELMWNLEGFVEGKYTVKEIVTGVRTEVKKGERVGEDLVNFLMAKGEKHCVGMMSVTHFFRMVKLMMERKIMSAKGKTISEVIRCGLGSHWDESMENKFNKCFSARWERSVGKGYKHIEWLMDDIVKGKWR